MDRTEKIDQVINDYRAERFADRKEEIKEYYKANRNEICWEFTRKVRRGIQSCQKEQKAVKNIILSVLYSSSLTKSYELQIAFCDERMFFDDTGVSSKNILSSHFAMKECFLMIPRYMNTGLRRSFLNMWRMTSQILRGRRLQRYHA